MIILILLVCLVVSACAVVQAIALRSFARYLVYLFELMKESRR